MRGGRVAVAAVAAVVLGSVFAGSAVACTCARGEPADRLAEADAALVGRLLSVEPAGVQSHGVEEGRFEYRILRVYRGGTRLVRGQTVTLRSSLSGAACGLPQGNGRRYGLLLSRYGGRWRANLCSTISPPELRAVARGSAMASASRPSGSGHDCAV